MTNAHILIVEDEGLVAADLEDRLTRLGYTVAGIADNGPDALRAARAHRVDLALMDIKIIGELDGVETASQLCDEFGLPVVYLTSHSDPRTLNRAGDTAPYGYIVKPYDERALQATIEMAFHRRAADERSRQISEWLTSVLLNLGEPILAANREARVLFLNPAAEDLTGWTFAEVKGRPLTEVLRLVNGQTGEPIANPLAPEASSVPAAEAPEETVLLTRDGRRRFVLSTATAMCDDAGEIIGTVVALADITERKAGESALLGLNQRLQAANHQLQATADALSHRGGLKPRTRL